MLSLADVVKLKTYLRPTLLYAREDWKLVETFVHSRGLPREWLQKLYMTCTRLDKSLPHYSGVVLHEFFQRCSLSPPDEMIVLKVFPAYITGVVQRVVPYEYGNASCKAIVQGSGSVGKFEAQIGVVAGKTLNVSRGDRVVIKHYGKSSSDGSALVGPRVCCLQGVETKGALGLVRSFKENLELNSTPDEDDTVLKELFESEAQHYAISFLQFSLQLSDFLTLSYVELLAFALEEWAGCDLKKAVKVFHRNSSTTQRKILTTILDVRFQEDSQGATDIEQMISFALVYPAFCYPLLAIQRQLKRKVNCKPKTNCELSHPSPISLRKMVEFPSLTDIEAAMPASVKDAWRQTSHALLKRVLSDNPRVQNEQQTGARRNLRRTKPTLNQIKQSSALQLFNTTRTNLLKEVKRLEKGSKVKRNFKPKLSYGGCMGCNQTKRLAAMDLCASCVKHSKALLAARGGYQFASGVLEAVSFDVEIQDPIGAVQRRSIWIEQFDEASQNSFYYNVADGSSVWELPKGTPPQTVVHLKYGSHKPSQPAQNSSDESSGAGTNSSDDSSSEGDSADTQHQTK